MRRPTAASTLRLLLACCFCFAACAPVLLTEGLLYPVRPPDFAELKLRFPAPTRFVPRPLGGISDRRLRLWTGFEHVRNLENLRLCWALNEIGGLHRVRPPKIVRMTNGVALPQFAVQKANQSGLLFVLSDFDIGPYLTLRYGSPEVRRVSLFSSRENLVLSMANRRGIVRFIMAGGTSAHVGLWMCDRVLFTLDRFYHQATERVEFWPSDWNCAKTAERARTIP